MGGCRYGMVPIWEATLRYGRPQSTVKAGPISGSAGASPLRPPKEQNGTEWPLIFRFTDWFCLDRFSQIHDSRQVIANGLFKWSEKSLRRGSVPA